MSKAKKKIKEPKAKSNKEASELFHSIIKASVNKENKKVIKDK